MKGVGLRSGKEAWIWTDQAQMLFDGLPQSAVLEAEWQSVGIPASRLLERTFLNLNGKHSDQAPASSNLVLSKAKPSTLVQAYQVIFFKVSFH